MNQSEWLRRIQALEQEQREHYAEGYDERGDAVGETICRLVATGRAKGFCLPDGRPALPSALKGRNPAS